MSDPQNEHPSALRWPEFYRQFAGSKAITRAQVFAFYRECEPFVRQTTLDWRIYELGKRNLLASVGRGRYVVAQQAADHFSYRPELAAAERKLWRGLVKQIPVPEGCFWSTAWVNQFSLHQSARHFLMVEVPRDYVQTVFYTLKDRYAHRVFLRPDPAILTYYVAETDHPIIVNAFVSRAPVQQVDQVPVPRLEKILVDLFSSPNLFAAYQGRELEIIFGNARRQYTLDERTLLSYAHRRHKGPQLQQFLRQVADWPESEFLS